MRKGNSQRNSRKTSMVITYANALFNDKRNFICILKPWFHAVSSNLGRGKTVVCDEHKTALKRERQLVLISIMFSSKRDESSTGLNTKYIMSYLLISTILLASGLIQPTTAAPTTNQTKCNFMEDVRKQGYQITIANTQVLQECPDKLSDCDTVGKPEAQNICRECCVKPSEQTKTVSKYYTSTL